MELDLLAGNSFSLAVKEFGIVSEFVQRDDSFPVLVEGFLES